MNYISNADCETAKPSLNGVNGDNFVVSSLSSTQKYSGAQSLRLVTDATATTDKFFVLGATALNTLTPGQMYTFSAWVYAGLAGGFVGADVYLRAYDHNGSGYLTYTSNTISAGATWEHLSVTLTLRSDCDECFVRIYVANTAAGCTIYADDLTLTEGTATTLHVAVDWGLDGFSTGDEVTADVLAASVITIERGRDQARQLSPPMAGKLSGIELDNTSRDYSRENSTGAHYGYILPNRPVRVQMDWNSTTYNLAKMYLTDITPRVGVGQRTVSLSGLGSLSRLKAQADGQKISTSLYMSITTDEALGYILDAVGWSTGDRVLDVGKTLLNWWWLNEEDAFAAAAAIVATEGPGAALYEDAQGRIVFESRHYRWTQSRCTVSNGTITAGEAYVTEPFGYNDGVRDVINACTIEQKVRTPESTASVVWSASVSYALAANETLRVPAVASEPFRNAIAPRSSEGDYTLAGGSLSFPMGISPDSGENLVISIFAGAAGATIENLRLRAYKVPVTATNLVKQTISSTDSQTNYGLRTYNVPVRAEIPLNVAQDFCNAVVGLYQAPRPTLEVHTVGTSTQALGQIVGREISDRMTIVENQTGTTGDYFVERIRHEIGAGGFWHEAAFACEKCSTEVMARWGSAGTIYTRWASTGFTSTDADKGKWGY